jgi:hypothetical protein
MSDTQIYGFTASFLHLHDTIVYHAETLESTLTATFFVSESDDYCKSKITEFAQATKIELKDPHLFLPKTGALGMPLDDGSDEDSELSREKDDGKTDRETESDRDPGDKLEGGLRDPDVVADDEGSAQTEEETDTE